MALNVLPPIQRIVASSLDSAGAAQYDYAARGLQVSLQLLVGGLVLASLPDWTVIRRRSRVLRVGVTRATAFATLLLLVAASVLLVAIEPIVKAVLERGAFTPADTETVSLLVRLLLPGFVAEGITLVLTQALLATRFTRLFIGIGFIRFAIQAVLTLTLGLVLGAIGVALAYSTTLALTVVLTTVAAARVGILRGGASVLARGILAGGASAVAAALLLAVGAEWVWLSAVIVVTVGAAGAYALRLIEIIPAGMARWLSPSGDRA